MVRAVKSSSLNHRSPSPRQLVIDALREAVGTGQLQVGQRLPTEHELAARLGVSRSSVNLAMTELRRQGIVEAVPGRGRLLVAPFPPLPAAGRERLAGGVVRVAVVLPLHDLGGGWHPHGLLAGLDGVAGERPGLIVEMLGHGGGRIEWFAERLALSRPEVVVFLKPVVASGPLVGVARQAGIPCVLTGMRLLDLGLPTVHEDSRGGMGLAVRHLVEHGHRRIGLLLPSEPVAWVFERRHGYEATLAALGLEADPRLVHWLGQSPGAEDVPGLRRFLERERPTALVSASNLCIPPLGLLARAGELRIPQDLSLVTFDQDYASYAPWLAGLRPTVVELPLAEIGRAVARLAVRLADGEAVEPVTALPCRLVEGDSVAPPAG